MKSFPVPDYGCQKRKDTTPFPLAHQGLNDLIARLRRDGNLTFRTELRTEPSEEQSNEMINLGNRSNRTLASASRGILLKAHRRRQSRNRIHVRRRHLLHKLPGVRIHRIKKAPLPFIENQVERQSAFTRSTDSGNDDKLPSRNLNGDVLQVVLPGTRYDYAVLHLAFSTAIPSSQTSSFSSVARLNIAHPEHFSEIGRYDFSSLLPPLLAFLRPQ